MTDRILTHGIYMKVYFPANIEDGKYRVSAFCGDDNIGGENSAIRCDDDEEFITLVERTKSALDAIPINK